MTGRFGPSAYFFLVRFLRAADLGAKPSKCWQRALIDIAGGNFPNLTDHPESVKSGASTGNAVTDFVGKFLAVGALAFNTIPHNVKRC